MTDPGVILLVTWDGGGNVPPMLSLGRQLARRGHNVSVLGSASLSDRVTEFGLDFTALTRVPELDRTRGTAIEDQIEAFFGQLTGAELSDDVAEALDRHHPDVVVIDCMQMAAFNAAETCAVATVALVHYLPCFALERGEGPSWAIPRLNVSRIAEASTPSTTRCHPTSSCGRAATGYSLATLRQFDDVPRPPPREPSLCRADP